MKDPGFEIVPRLVSYSKIPRVLRNPIPVIQENMKKYGDPYGVRIGGDGLVIVTTKPQIVQHFLQKNHRNYSKSDVQTKQLARFIGKGLLTLDGKEWLKQRRLIQPGFHKQRIEGIKGKMEEAVESFFEDLAARVKYMPEVDMHHEMMVLAFQVVSYSLFGNSVTDEHIRNLRKAIEISQEALMKLIRLPFLEWWLRMSGTLGKALRWVDISSEDILEIIRNRRGGVPHGDLLDMLLEATYEDTGETMSDQQLLFELLVLFTAGHETSANCLCWTIYLLAKHPDKLERLRQEIGNGNRDYCLQVINESLRMYPPAWVTDRMALVDDQIGDIRIPKNSRLVSFIYGMHHHEGYWRNPGKFEPDRFEDMREIAPYTFLPFGGGPRLCIGMQFAMMEIEIALTHFVKHFDFELVDRKEIEMNPQVTLNPRSAVRMRLRAV